MFRLAATDLDGTLLKSDKTISKETEEALSSLYEKGVLFVPSTGRTHIELPDPVKNIANIRYAITCNGGGVYDFCEERYIFNHTIDRKLAEEVLEVCLTLPVYPTFVCEGRRYILTDENGRIADYVKSKAAPGIVDNATGCRDIIEAVRGMDTGLQKIFLYSKDPEATQSILLRLQKEFPKLSITTSGPLYVEINAPNIDKGKTLALLCEHLNIPIEESVAFGDAGNDIAMLETAGFAVVPEDGTDEAKAVADMLCESCDNDGVRKTLKRFEEEGRIMHVTSTR